MKSFANIVYSFFGRDSGSSEGLFSSLNCSKFVGDDIDSVEKNLEFVRESIGAKKLITLNQIHSAKCIVVGEKNESDKGNESDPKGNDWWAEAIGTYSAWEYTDSGYEWKLRYYFSDDIR